MRIFYDPKTGKSHPVRVRGLKRKDECLDLPPKNCRTPCGCVG